MTREELRDYVEEQRNLNNIPYHVYSTLIDGIDTLEQELFINKPCVSSGVCEHDKNKVLDKIREQMKDYLRGVEITLEVLVENDPLRPKMEGAKDTLEECLDLIDKAETEE